MCCADMADGHVNRRNAVRYQLETGVWYVSTKHRGKAGSKTAKRLSEARGHLTQDGLCSVLHCPGCSLQGVVCCPKRSCRSGCDDTELDKAA